MKLHQKYPNSPFYSRRANGWKLFILALFLWGMGLNSYIYSTSTPSDYNKHSGTFKAAKVRSYTYYQHRRYRTSVKKTGWELMILINESLKTYYLGNNFEKEHYDIKELLEESESVVIWSLPDSGEGLNRERIYQLEVDGRKLVRLKKAVERHTRSYFVFMIPALILTGIAVFIWRPDWWNAMSQKSNEEIEEQKVEVIDFYASKFEKKTDSELQAIVDNPSEYTKDAIKAARRVLKNRKK